MRTDEIVNKAFSRSFMGYDIEQVDAFLDELIDCIERYEAEKREMLSAMEYLLGKLENGQKLPISEMRKAIGASKPPKKRTERTVSERSEEKRSPVKPPDKEKREEVDTHAEKRARAVLRKPADGASQRRAQESEKPKRAPRVQRVMKPQEEEKETVAIEYETGDSAPHSEDWLDALLDDMQVEPRSTAPAKADEPDDGQSQKPDDGDAEARK